MDEEFQGEGPDDGDVRLCDGNTVSVRPDVAARCSQWRECTSSPKVGAWLKYLV